jgi:phytoene desaturase
VARVTVIGAGVGGLATAARLASSGHHVTVCEQAAEIGGKLGVLERDGFRFDTGPSLLTMPHVLADTFAATGAPMKAVLDLEPVEPIARYRFADGARLDTSADPVETAGALESALSPGSSLDWQRLMRRAAHIWDAVEQPFLRQPLRAPALARRLRHLPTIAPGRTLRDLGRQYLRDPRLRMLLDRYATYAGSDPRRAPAALATIPYAEQAFGAWYVRGGLGTIAQALADRASSLGAKIHTGADVVAVEQAGGRASGVRLADGQRLAADVVVCNADAAHLYEDLVDGPAARTARRRLRRVTPSLSGFVLLLGVRGASSGLAHHNVLFPADYDAEFGALFGPDPRPVPDPTLYVVVPRDLGVAPAGCEAWFVLVNAPRHGQGDPPVDWGDPALVQRYRERVLDLLEARGLDVRSRLQFCEVQTPLDLAQRTRAVGGAIYGTSSNGPRAAFLRPANRSPLPGLYLVGGSAHPGGGLPLVLRSAEIVAGLVGPA